MSDIQIIKPKPGATYRNGSNRPTNFRLISTRHGALVLQGWFEWFEFEAATSMMCEAGGDWRDIPTVPMIDREF